WPDGCAICSADGRNPDLRPDSYRYWLGGSDLGAAAARPQLERHGDDQGRSPADPEGTLPVGAASHLLWHSARDGGDRDRLRKGALPDRRANCLPCVVDKIPNRGAIHDGAVWRTVHSVSARSQGLRPGPVLS